MSIDKLPFCYQGKIIKIKTCRYMYRTCVIFKGFLYSNAHSLLSKPTMSRRRFIQRGSMFWRSCLLFPRPYQTWQEARCFLITSPALVIIACNCSNFWYRPGMEGGHRGDPERDLNSYRHLSGTGNFKGHAQTFKSLKWYKNHNVWFFVFKLSTVYVNSKKDLRKLYVYNHSRPWQF